MRTHGLQDRIRIALRKWLFAPSSSTSSIKLVPESDRFFDLPNAVRYLLSMVGSREDKTCV
jgi:hypothetical protein